MGRVWPELRGCCPGRCYRRSWRGRCSDCQQAHGRDAGRSVRRAMHRTVRALKADIASGETDCERLLTASVAGRRPQMLFLAFEAEALFNARQYVVSITSRPRKTQRARPPTGQWRERE